MPKQTDMLRDFFRGFIKVHILYHVSREEVYGVQFIDELARHGYHLSPGTLYPLLHSLEESHYVQREDRIVEGKVRKYYRITASGIDALQQARAKIRELVDEVLEDNDEMELTTAGASSSAPTIGRSARISTVSRRAAAPHRRSR